MIFYGIIIILFLISLSFILDAEKEGLSRSGSLVVLAALLLCAFGITKIIKYESKPEVYSPAVIETAQAVLLQAKENPEVFKKTIGLYEEFLGRSEGRGNGSSAESVILGKANQIVLTGENKKALEEWEAWHPVLSPDFVSLEFFGAMVSWAILTFFLWDFQGKIKKANQAVLIKKLQEKAPHEFHDFVGHWKRGDVLEIFRDEKTCFNFFLRKFDRGDELKDISSYDKEEAEFISFNSQGITLKRKGTTFTVKAFQVLSNLTFEKERLADVIEKIDDLSLYKTQVKILADDIISTSSGT